MATMPGNPHYTEDLAGSTQLPEHAAAQATLVLAHEQRIANLIAIYSDNFTESMVNPEGWRAVEEQIAEGLGLTVKRPARGEL